MVRRRKERLDVITEIKTTDGFTMALKTVAVTDSKLTATKRAELREAILTFLNEKTSNMSFYEIVFYELFHHKF